MPLPTVLVIAFGTGVLAAWAARFELRVSPRPALLARAFAAYLAYDLLLFVPVTVYFYAFHGDWFLLYLVDVDRIPSAVALLGFLLEAGVGVGGFVLGASLIRAQRDKGVLAIAAATLPASVLPVGLAPTRLGQVGSYAEFVGQFGLTSYASGPLLPGAVVMGAFLLAGLLFLVLRLQSARG